MFYYNPYYDDLKDERLEITEERLIDDIKFINGYLHPKETNICPICGSKNVISYGKRKRTIKCDLFAHYKSNLLLTYHRFQCKDCFHIFNDTTSIISKGESIARNTKIQILLDLKEDHTFKYIAIKNNVSEQTVIELFEKYINPVRRVLPDTICLDEFKNLKSADGKYAFLILDPMSHKVIDVLPDRKTETLENYFYTIHWDERKKVKYVVTDMYYAYRTLIKRFFPNATHVVDAFHYTEYVSDAFNDVRIRIQGQFDTNTKEYRVIKNNWRLLSLYIKELPSKECYNAFQQKYTSPSDILNDCLSLSNELAGAYSLYQDFLISLNDVKLQNAEKFIEDWIKTLNETYIKEFHNIKNTFINWKYEIINSFIRFGDKRLHNGYIEGINNHIKVIKRISYGYRNFRHFRNRIMYIINQDCLSKNYYLY